MKRLKKLAVLCAGCLAFAGIAPVFPAETAVYAEETPTSGTCGENLTWNFDEATGTLTIEGSGEMNHSVMDEGFLYTSWQGVEQQQIKKVELPDGLTSIGNYAFFSCYNLTSIIIPESVISIGKYAFFRCTRLTDITMSPNITSIGDNALSDTPWFDALSAESDLFIVNHEVIRGGGQGEIRIPDGVTSIGKNAFSNCTELTDIILPDTLEKIEPYAFYGCKGLVDITIPKNVKMIGKEAFLTCDSLKNLTLASFLC